MEMTRVKQTSPTRMLMLGMLGLMGIVFLASGCQTIQSSKLTDLDNARFMSLWQTYNECKAASDLSQASSGQKQLSSAAYAQPTNGVEGFLLPLPAKLEQMVSAPPSRLAVDIHAMTASCSLHTGQLALHEGQIDAAREAFSSVLTLPQDISPYYVLQAKRFLTELDQGIDVSIRTP
jgi:hypothetical protein